MHKTLETICNSLDSLAELILKQYTDDRTMTELWGWNFPPLNRHDLANLSIDLSLRIRAINVEVLDDPFKTRLEAIPKRIGTFKASTIPYLFNGHGNSSVPVYIALIQYIEIIINPLFSWKNLKDSKAVPRALFTRVENLQEDLNEIVINKDKLKEDIALIGEAVQAAENLPVDLRTLNEAKINISGVADEATKLFGKIEQNHNDSKSAVDYITEKKSETDLLIASCEEAYKITTNKGLAGAFDQRARRLNHSLVWWVLGLLAALGLGAWIGAVRFELMSETLKMKDINPNAIWMEFVLSILGVAAPIWFAWLATKQINHRFKLAEDYAFKASVAKTYEGYRREAARIDPVLEARLFSSTLERFEEAPLRLVGDGDHSSPMQEFLNSDSFKSALESVPELKNDFIALTRRGIEGFTKNGKDTKIKETPVEEEV